MWVKDMDQQVSIKSKFKIDKNYHSLINSCAYSTLTGVWLEICGDAVEEWKKGQKYYDFFNPGPAEGAKEFTQVVWKESKEFGKYIE